MFWEKNIVICLTLLGEISCPSVGIGNIVVIELAATRVINDG